MVNCLSRSAVVCKAAMCAFGTSSQAFVSRLFMLIVMAVLLAGCGTPKATMLTPRGADLMLLVHDPVAYFTMGRPVVGHRR